LHFEPALDTIRGVFIFFGDNMVKKSNEQSNEQNLLPEFEATLKSAEFLDLDKEKINKLADESLRRVTEFISLKQL
jgi:hypothetical protein